MEFSDFLSMFVYPACPSYSVKAFLLVMGKTRVYSIEEGYFSAKKSNCFPKPGKEQQEKVAVLIYARLLGLFASFFENVFLK